MMSGDLWEPPINEEFIKGNPQRFLVPWYIRFLWWLDEKLS